MAEFTPPPWKWEYGYNNGGMATGFFFIPANNQNASVEMLIDDAILAAASPNLYLALKGLEDPYEPGRFCDHAAEPCARCEAARKALARAEGKGMISSDEEA
jgi:hypothetical protein